MKIMGCCSSKTPQDTTTTTQLQTHNNQLLPEKNQTNAAIIESDNEDANDANNEPKIDNKMEKIEVKTDAKCVESDRKIDTDTVKEIRSDDNYNSILSPHDLSLHEENKSSFVDENYVANPTDIVSNHHIDSSVTNASKSVQNIETTEQKTNMLTQHNLMDLLKKWELSKYGQILIDDQGYDVINDWKHITKQDLERMKFKTGHAQRFLRNVEKYFQDGNKETDNEIQSPSKSTPYIDH
eukprot:413931_1